MTFKIHIVNIAASSNNNSVYIRGAFKKYAEFFNFLLISIYNEFIFQHNLRHRRCTSPGGVSIYLYHFGKTLQTDF